MIRLVLPVPPSTNNWVRTGPRGTPILSREARAYKAAAERELRAMKLTPIKGLVAFAADVYRQRRSGDLGNVLKVLEDVLRGFAYVDDSQTVDIKLRRFDDPDFPRVVVTVTHCVQALGTCRLGDMWPGYERIRRATEAAHAITLGKAQTKRTEKKQAKRVVYTSATYRSRP